MLVIYNLYLYKYVTTCHSDSTDIYLLDLNKLQTSAEFAAIPNQLFLDTVMTSVVIVQFGHATSLQANAKATGGFFFKIHTYTHIFEVLISSTFRYCDPPTHTRTLTDKN